MTRKRPNTFTKPEAERDPLGNIGNFKPRAVQYPASAEETRRVAEESGFSARQAPPSSCATIDARRLNPTPRTAQLNMRLSPQTKDRFWQYAQECGFRTGEEALIALLESGKR